MIKLHTPNGLTVYIALSEIAAVLPPVGGVAGSGAKILLKNHEAQFVRETPEEVATASTFSTIVR